MAATTATKKKAATNGGASNTIKSRIVTVTPAKAAEWLERNDHNRKINSHDVDTWTREMLEGRWALDGDAIRFDVNGTLLNGQHRLSAVVKSDTTQQFVVLTGLPTERQANMDTGRRRTAANALELIGTYGGYTAALAAAGRIATRVNRSGLNAERFTGIAVSNQEIIDFIEVNPELFEAVKFILPIYRNTATKSVGVAAYAYWRMQLIDPDAAREFWTALASGADLPVGSPILALYRRLSLARYKREHISHQNQLSLIFRTWNAWRQGGDMKKLQVRNSRGGEDIAIPEPI